MKRLLYLLSTISAMFLVTSCKESPRIDIVPYPNEIILGEGTFNAKGAPVTYDASLEEMTVNIIKSFAHKLSAISGAENAISTDKIEEGFEFLYNPDIPSEAYTLEVTPGLP